MYEQRTLRWLSPAALLGSALNLDGTRAGQGSKKLLSCGPTAWRARAIWALQHGVLEQIPSGSVLDQALGMEGLESQDGLG